MHEQATPVAVRLDISKLADSIVKALETAQAQLELAEREARLLAKAADVPGFTLARFNYPVIVETRGLADDLSSESGSEVTVEQMLRDARELQQLIALAKEPAA